MPGVLFGCLAQRATPGYEVRIGGELIRPVHAVSVEGSDDGLHLFADPLDAEAFCRAVRRRDGEARITTEVLRDNSGADRLIDAQRVDRAARTAREEPLETAQSIRASQRGIQFVYKKTVSSSVSR